MKSFREYLNESIVDQYKAVRAAAIPGDELMRTDKLWISNRGYAINRNRDVPSTLQSHIDGKTPPAILPTWDGNSLYSGGVYKGSIAHTDVGIGRQWEDLVDTNSHELGHAAQEVAQDRDRASGKLEMTRKRGVERWGPKLFPISPQMLAGKPKRSVKRKLKKNKEIMRAGWLGAEGVQEPAYEYMNRDIEINARVIGHSARHLDRRPDPDRPNTTAHMQDLANRLRWNVYNGGSDPVKSRQGVQAAIEDLRREKLGYWRANERNITSRQGEPTLTPRSIQMGERQFSRILQHHEEQLPEDIHTPQGRDAFIRAHETNPINRNWGK